MQAREARRCVPVHQLLRSKTVGPLRLLSASVPRSRAPACLVALQSSTFTDLVRRETVETRLARTMYPQSPNCAWPNPTRRAHTRSRRGVQSTGHVRYACPKYTCVQGTLYFSEASNSLGGKKAMTVMKSSGIACATTRTAGVDGPRLSHYCEHHRIISADPADRVARHLPGTATISANRLIPSQVVLGLRLPPQDLLGFGTGPSAKKPLQP